MLIGALICTLVLGGYALLVRSEPHEKNAGRTDTVATGAIARPAASTTATANAPSATGVTGATSATVAPAAPRGTDTSPAAQAAARIAQLVRTRRPATPTSADALASFLPAELDGFRTAYAPHGAVIRSGGTTIARGDATYERGNAVVRVSVTDAAFQSTLYPTAVIAGEMRADTANGAGSLGLLLDGAVGQETCDMHTGMYELHMVVADRYVVDITAQRGLMPQEGRAIFRAVDRRITPTAR